MPVILDLDDNQKQAVVGTLGKPSLVISGAGSGKTRVLTNRIAYLIKQMNAPQSEILAVTFTNKAAREMKQRIVNLIGDKCQDLWMGTFHSICMRLLRMFGRDIGISPNFSIYDTDDQIKMVIESAKTAGYVIDKYTARTVLGRISKSKSRLEGPSEFLGKVASKEERMSADIYAAYQEKLEQHQALDFDDLIMKAVHLIRLSKDAKTFCHRFQWVMVDEYQDTNVAQNIFIDEMRSPTANVFVVGDDQQSIYRFRGAEVKNILDFKNQHNADVVILDRNYRSTKQIVDASNALIAHNTMRLEKTVSALRDGVPIFAYVGRDGNEEAEYIASNIREMINTGFQLSNCAVLYRTNYLSQPIEKALRAVKVPYEIIGGFSFYQRLEIKDVLAFLSVLVNPQDDVNFERIFLRQRGLGKKSFSALKNRATDLRTSAFRLFFDLSFNDKIEPFVAPFRSFLERLVDQKDAPPSILIKMIWNENLKGILQDDGDTIESRDKNISELISEAREYSSVEDFLGQVSLLTSVDKTSKDDCVKLMTIHASKGLEFPIVYLMGLNEGIIPHVKSVDPEDIEEERRLCYVGMTRAMDVLHLTWAEERQSWGEISRMDCSRFVREIPEQYILRRW
jgi:DNA helicase-2/ATP-dependent DNA helicase PcrA